MSAGPLQFRLLALLAGMAVGFAATALARAAETALLTLHASGRFKAHGGTENTFVDVLLSQQDRLVLSLRAFDLLAKTLAALCMAVLFSDLLGQDHPLAAYAAGGFLALLATIVLAEIVPKSVPEESAFTVSLFLAPFAWIIVKVMSPLIAIHLWLGRRLSHRAGGEGKEDDSEPDISEIEFRTMLSLGEIEGIIEEDTRDIIEGIFTFGDSVAAEIMTPRADLVAFSTRDLDEAAVLAYLREGAHSRVLVYERSIDRIVGALERKTVLLNPGKPLLSRLRKPIFVPENRKLIDLLADMKRSRIHFAIVLDEYGGTAGIVTMKDLLNEIVGELEYDANRGGEGAAQ